MGVDKIIRDIQTELNCARAELAASRQENTELRAMRDQQFSVLQQVRAELKTSQQRVSELEAEAVHHRAEWAQAMSDIVRLREALRQWQLGIGDTEAERKIAELQTTLASREAALRDVAHLLGPWTQPAEGRPRGLTAAVKLAYDRAAQEVGRG